MRGAVKTQWLERLRSGDLQQGMGNLHTSHRTEEGTEVHEFCCLGVLCEAAVEAGIADRVVASESGPNKVYGYVRAGQELGDPDDCYLPRVVQEWADIDSPNPSVSRPARVSEYISNVNDDGGTFPEIADLIQEQF